MVRLELDEDEAQLLEDILGMWVDGIEDTVKGIVDPDAELEWHLHQLRRQFTSCQRVRLRLNLERTST